MRSCSEGSGGGLFCVISLPQVVRTIHAKQLDGISSATYWLVLANAAAWTAWSLLTGEYAPGGPALVNGPVAIVILHPLVAGRQVEEPVGERDAVDDGDATAEERDENGVISEEAQLCPLRRRRRVHPAPRVSNTRRGVRD